MGYQIVWDRIAYGYECASLGVCVNWTRTHCIGVFFIALLTMGIHVGIHTPSLESRGQLMRNLIRLTSPLALLTLAICWVIA